MTPASPVHILMLRRRWIQSRSWNTVFVLSQVRTSVVLGEAHEFLYGCALLRTLHHCIRHDLTSSWHGVAQG